MSSVTEYPTATPEIVWAALRELTVKQAETDRQMQETDRMIKKLSQNIGGIENSNGAFAEEYFAQAFKTDDTKTFAGMHFDRMATNLNMKDLRINRQDEYDIVLYNNESIVIIETKYKGRERNIDDVIKKAESFRFWFPQYRNHKVYLGLASLSFEGNTIKNAKEKGIAIIRQQGGKTIVNDKNLVAY